jgi:hypothetical protein
MGLRLHIRTTSSHYWFAENGGGSGVTGRGVWPREWETFELVPRYASNPYGNNQPVALRTHTGQYVTVAPGDPLLLATSTTMPGTEGTFTISFLPGQGVAQLDHLVRFGLRTAAGAWVCAENGGGDVLRANRTALGPWETFVAEHHPEPRGFVRHVALRAGDGRWFLRAANGGGGSAGTDAVRLGDETRFDLVAADRAARDFPHGARVHLRTTSGHYLQAVNGGGTDVTFGGPWPRQWETFVLHLPEWEPPALAYGSQLALRTDAGFYVDATGGAHKASAPKQVVDRTNLFTFTTEAPAGQPTFEVRCGSTANREDTTTSTAFTRLVGPGQGFDLPVPSTLQVLLVGEVRTNQPGAAVEAHITIDGQVANPGVVRLADGTAYRTGTLLAWLSVGAGWHTVDAQWRCVPSGAVPATAYARNRTLAVLGPA